MHRNTVRKHLLYCNIIYMETRRDSKYISHSSLNRSNTTGGRVHVNVHISRHGANTGQAVQQAPGPTTPPGPVHRGPSRACMR